MIFYMVKKVQHNNNFITGTRGGNHGRLGIPKVTRLINSKKKLRKQKGGMVRSSTRIRPGITAKKLRKQKGGMVRSSTRIRPGITAKKLRKQKGGMVRSSTRIRPGITAKK